MKVVTGATGRVGRLVAEALLARGERVRVVGRSASTLAPLVAKGAEAFIAREPNGLARAFDGAEAAFVMTPVDVRADDVNAVQYAFIDAQVEALRRARPSHVVVLSSWGAELTTPVGGIIACHHFEQALTTVPGLSVLRLRPVWFMENFLWGIPLIKLAGLHGLGIGPQVRFPMISTRDIAPVAVARLVARDFEGHVDIPLDGPAEHTLVEVTKALGDAVGLPKLQYVHLPDGVLRRGLASGGLTPNAATLAMEITRGIHTGVVHAPPRTPASTTPTTLAEFAHTVFAPAFHAAPEPSFGAKLGGFGLRSWLRLTA